jgi:hypothetical protein
VVKPFVENVVGKKITCDGKLPYMAGGGEGLNQGAESKNLSGYVIFPFCHPLEYRCTAGIGMAVPKLGTALVTSGIYVIFVQNNTLVRSKVNARMIQPRSVLTCAKLHKIIQISYLCMNIQ